MANLDINMLKLRISTISNFDGSTEMLNSFLAACPRVLNNYADPVTQNTHGNLLLSLLQAKLVKRAQTQLDSKTFTI